MNKELLMMWLIFIIGFVVSFINNKTPLMYAIGGVIGILIGIIGERGKKE